MKCPVCGADCKVDRDMMDYTVMESHTECPNGHYSDDFMTGYSTLVIGDFQWDWSWTDPSYGAPTRSGKDNAIILTQAQWREKVPGPWVPPSYDDRLLPDSLLEP